MTSITSPQTRYVVLFLAAKPPDFMLTMSSRKNMAAAIKENTLSSVRFSSRMRGSS